jgi:hypothetical protein
LQNQKEAARRRQKERRTNSSMMPSSSRAEAFNHQTVHQDICWEDVKKNSGVFLFQADSGN